MCRLSVSLARMDLTLLCLSRNLDHSFRSSPLSRSNWYKWGDSNRRRHSKDTDSPAVGRNRTQYICENRILDQGCKENFSLIILSLS